MSELIINETNMEIKPPVSVLPGEITADLVSDFNADDIMAEILSINEEGHFSGNIICTLEKLHNVKEGMQLEDVADDDHEMVDALDVDLCKVDFYSLDGENANIVLTFDTPKSQYLREINDLFNRYRVLQEEIALSDYTEKDVVLMLSLIIMPERFAGLGSCVATFPLIYMRTIDDNGQNVSFHMMYKMGNVQFQKIVMSEEERIRLEAEALREVDNVSAGQIY